VSHAATDHHVVFLGGPGISYEEYRPPPELAEWVAAEAELVADGFDVLHPTKTEPWGQAVTRVQAPEGTIVGISYAPWMHG
jgi:hypothetical protein